jgi:hypothetical protein
MGTELINVKFVWSKNSALLAIDFLLAAGGSSLVNPYVPEQRFGVDDD